MTDDQIKMMLILKYGSMEKASFTYDKLTDDEIRVTDEWFYASCNIKAPRI